jgi:hypothetical protein
MRGAATVEDIEPFATLTRTSWSTTLASMRNVTITLDEEVARWVRVEAAKQETSVSRLVGEMLREHMRSQDSYEVARRQFFTVQPRPLRGDDSPLPSREELHDRTGLDGLRVIDPFQASPGDLL